LIVVGYDTTSLVPFFFNLSVKIKDRLLTESARKLAAERHRFMVAYFEQLEQEVRGLA
jgi:HD superfamily phosphodiesterase